MPNIFKKLNLTTQEEILVVNPPESFKAEVQSLKAVSVKQKIEDIESLHFMLAFITQKDEIDFLAKQIKEKIKGDAIIWFAYPKMSSKKYLSQVNRDNGWESLEMMGLKGVRQVAIDDNWSAIRFRCKEFVRSIR